jgi:hypothetical protein
LGLANGFLVILEQLVDLLHLFVHFLHLCAFDVDFFVVRLRLVIWLLFLIFGCWSLLAFLKVLRTLALLLGLLLASFFLIVILLWLWGIMPESWLVTCHKLTPKPVEEIIDIEKCRAAFG